MKCDQAGIDFIKFLEDFRSAPYRDIAGVYTIGYGHTNGVTKDTPPISEEKADDLLEEDLDAFEDAVSRYVTINLCQDEFNALVAFAFNEGIEEFRTSTLLKKLNEGDRQGAAKQFDRWIYFTDEETGESKVSPGLVNRRVAEKAMFLSNFTITRQNAT